VVNERKYLIPLILLLVLLLLGGCTRAKPERESLVLATRTMVYSPLRKVELRLRYPIGQNKGTEPLNPFTVVVDNCRGSEALTEDHEETCFLTMRCDLDLSKAPEEISPQESEMVDFVRRAYGFDSAQRSGVKGVIPLKAPPHTKVKYTLRWLEVWDQNVLELVSNREVKAAIPVKVLYDATLTVVKKEEEPCLRGTEPSRVNVPVVAGKRTATLPAPTLTATESLTVSLPAIIIPGSDEAIALVRDYLQALQERDFKRAYALLHPAYQARVPFDRYVEGYAPVLDWEIRGIEATKVDKYRELVDVGLTLGIERQGKVVYTDWIATYEVVVTRGKPPYHRSIGSVRMRPLLEE